MVGKDDELAEIDDESLARVKLIAEKKRQLELTAEQVRQSIKASFDQVHEALRNREKQLLRQVEAIHRQQISLAQSNSELLPSISNLNASFDDEQELIQRLLNFGKIDLSNSIAVNDSEPYKAEEYQEASEDIVNFDKSLKSESQEFDVSSVIRRKRDSSGLHSKNISINLNCTSCEACKFETSAEVVIKRPVVSTPSTSKQLPAVSPLSPSTTSSSSSSKSSTPGKENLYSPGPKVSGNFDKPLYKDSPLSPEPCSSSSSSSSSGHFEKLYFKETLSSKPSSSDSSDKLPLKDAADVNEDERVTGEKVTMSYVDTKDESNPSNNDEVDACKSAGNEMAAIKVQDGESEHPVQIQQWLKQILVQTETEPIIHEIGQFTKIPNTRLYREFPVET